MYQEVFINRKYPKHKKRNQLCENDNLIQIAIKLRISYHLYIYIFQKIKKKKINYANYYCLSNNKQQTNKEEPRLHLRFNEKSVVDRFEASQTWARDLWASASRAATVATPFKTLAAFSHIGVKAWQWPHQGAKNSTKTTPFEFKTCHSSKISINNLFS